MNATIHTNIDRCKGCAICVEICQAGVLEISEGVNRNGYRYPQIKDEGACLRCGVCEMLCPDFAIWVISLEEETV